MPLLYMLTLLFLKIENGNYLVCKSQIQIKPSINIFTNDSLWEIQHAIQLKENL